MEKKLKIINSFIAGATAAIIFITAITIFAELEPFIKNWLKNTFWHHWLGKSISSIIVFVLIFLVSLIIPSQPSEEKTVKNLWRIFWAAGLGTTLVFGFFIYKTFIKH